MVSLKLKLLSSVYIFAKFINSLLNLWFQFCLNSPIFTSRLIKDQFYYADKVGYTNSIISKAGFIGGEVKVGVLVVLILAKLFLKRQSIYLELNFPLVTICSLRQEKFTSIFTAFGSIFGQIRILRIVISSVQYRLKYGILPHLTTQCS